jgi:hypothetical protein
MKSLMENVFVLLVVIVMFWVEFGGIYHAHTKHNEGLLAIFPPPLVWYRSVGFFWHDDFSGVGWDKKHENDLFACAYFLTKFNIEDANIPKLNFDVEEFSAKIAAYPQDKQEFLVQPIKRRRGWSC